MERILRKFSPKAKAIRKITLAIYLTCIPITIVISKQFNKIGPLYHLGLYLYHRCLFYRPKDGNIFGLILLRILT